MILTGNEIEVQFNANRLVIAPFRPEQINPNSYDLRLGPQLLEYTEEILDTRQPNPYKIVDLPKQGLRLAAGSFYLGSTEEVVGSDHFVPILHAKSGIARLGLFVHVTADLVDIGWAGNLTLQLHPTKDIILRPGMLIAQVSFWQPVGEIALYEGKYKNSRGPQASRIHE